MIRQTGNRCHVILLALLTISLFFRLQFRICTTLNNKIVFPDAMRIRCLSEHRNQGEGAGLSLCFNIFTAILWMHGNLFSEYFVVFEW